MKYDQTSEWFIEYMKTNEPPYYLSLELVKKLAKEHNYASDDDDLLAVWSKMLNEFCPIELWSRKWIDLPKRIDDLDDNRDYVYSWGNNMHLDYRDTFIYRISSEPIAMLLRLAA